ncbi:hypothetical protein IU444_19260 [Nocardia farcinica]|uniref:hypothetical protein n=1 Tax=Nocardia farcinica TaxID=37329 RepID=UPI00189573B3|nr:hypothetical protein [Nocardia farcinica]MBF6386265.1 hypothetical protein [Nocardia farcinica]
MTTPEQPRPGVEFGKSSDADAAATPPADPTVVHRGDGPRYPAAPPFDAPGTPPAPYPAPGHASGVPGSYPPPGGYPGPRFGPAAAPPPGPFGRPGPGTYPPPVYTPPGRLGPAGYEPTQTQIYSIISFSCVAAGLASVFLFCGFPILVIGPVGITLGVLGQRRGESLGMAATIANIVVFALLLVLLIFLAGSFGLAFWSS